MGECLWCRASCFAEKAEKLSGPWVVVTMTCGMTCNGDLQVTVTCW